MRDTAARTGGTSPSAAPVPPRWPLHIRIYRAALARLERWFGLKLVVIYRRPLLADHGTTMRIDETYSFRELTEQDLLRFSDDPALGLSRDFIHNALKSGDVSFGVLHADRLVSYRWYAFSGTTPCEHGLSMRYAYPGRTFGYKAFTDPSYRGKRLQDYCMQHADPILLRRGCTHTIGYIALYNLPSLRVVSRARDTKFLGIIAYTTVLRRNLAVATPAVRRNRISMVADAS